MSSTTQARWERARQQMVERWQEILRRIDTHDRGVILAMANVLDEYCEEAAVERQIMTGRRSDPAIPILKFPVGSSVSGRCVFCRGFGEFGGCFGMLRELNQAVLDAEWPRARAVAQQYLERLSRMDLCGPVGQRVH